MADDKSWDGETYQARFDELAAKGVDVHGEATFVSTLELDPPIVSVLDAGCGTGRVGIELARRGFEVVGVDVDASMLAVAREKAPEIDWLESDLVDLDLGRTFDVVLMAGNVPLFTPPGTHAAMVAGCARHVRPGGGLLVAGFQLDRGYSLSAYDGHCRDAHLSLAQRWATWDRRRFGVDPEPPVYAVSVHRREG